MLLHPHAQIAGRRDEKTENAANPRAKLGPTRSKMIENGLNLQRAKDGQLLLIKNCSKTSRRGQYPQLRRAAWMVSVAGMSRMTIVLESSGNVW